MGKGVFSGGWLRSTHTPAKVRRLNCLASRQIQRGWDLCLALVAKLQLREASRNRARTEVGLGALWRAPVRLVLATVRDYESPAKRSFEERGHETGAS